MGGTYVDVKFHGGFENRIYFCEKIQEKLFWTR